MEKLEKLIATFDKNASEEVRVQLREFHGHQLLDMRVYYRPDDGGEPRPTRKGLSVSVNLIPKILDAIQSAMAELRAAGLEPKSPQDGNAGTATGEDQTEDQTTSADSG